ncbi:hypothetical protein ACRAWD_24175 [Caulobacter segnis]
MTPEPALYLAARAEGLKRYCTEPNGFRVGREGHAYAGVRPPPAEAEFPGRLRGRRTGPRGEPTAGIGAIGISARPTPGPRSAPCQADGVEDELRNPKLNDEQTHELRDRLNRLRRERREAIEDGRRAEAAIRDAEREVDDPRARFLAPLMAVGDAP